MKSPRSLQECGKTLWKSIVADYKFEDSAA